MAGDYHDEEHRAARRVRLDAVLLVLDRIVGLLREERATDDDGAAQELIDAALVMLDELAIRCRPPE